MSWTASDQRVAEERHATLKNQFDTRLAAWKDTLGAGVDGQGQAAVEDTLTRWRTHLQNLQEASTALTGDNSTLDRISVLATQVADEKSVLRKLRSEAGTRVDQANTVNPKISGIPATNILGLNRTFRSSTRLYLLIFSIVFGVLAAAALVYFVYSSRVVQNTVGIFGMQTGGAARHK